jgi:hypothetical protein
MWVYEQSTGRLLHDGVFIWQGYSGRNEGLNNSAMQGVKMIGPLPEAVLQGENQLSVTG